MAMWLKRNTAVSVKIGPFLDSSNGNTQETGLTISQGNVRLSKNGGNMAQKVNASSCSHDEIGYYDCPLAVTDVNTLGRLKLMAHPTGALAVWHEYMVVTTNAWDSLFGADRLQVHTAEMSADLISSAIFAAGAIAASTIAADAITSGHFKAGAIAASTIAADAIAAGKIAADAISAGNFKAGAIAASTIAADAIAAGKIAADAISAGNFKAGAIAASTIATNAITSDKIAAGAIAAGKIAADAVSAGNFKAGAIAASTFATDAITSQAIASSAIDEIQTISVSNQTVLAKVDSAMEADGAVHRFTENALEQAPSGVGVGDWTAAEKKQIRYRLGVDGDTSTPSAAPHIEGHYPNE